MKVKELTRMLHGLEGFDLKDCAITSEILDALEAKPVVHGEWIEVDEQPYFRKHFHTRVCSICRMKKDGNWNYCPNCGADRREES